MITWIQFNNNPQYWNKQDSFHLHPVNGEFPKNDPLTNTFRLTLIKG